MYRLIPCRHGVCASPSTAVTRALRENKSTTGIEGVILLPGGIERDILVQDESIIFPGPISLEQDDIKNLDCLNPDNFSFTHYGPDSQDKTTNQDFALSGHFTGRSDGIARFSILADGISNGFAFPQRGAQLSCFAAYRCLKAFYGQFAGKDTALNEKNIGLFRDSLASGINQFFQLDRAHLLHLFEEDHREPSGIASKVWQKYFKEKPEKWYGNTLLISFLSSFGGFVIYAGDGGIILLKGEKSPKEIIRSSESLAVDRFAMMGVKPAAFLGALIGCDPSDGFVEIISVTDGIDRTWQTNEMDLAREFSAESSLAHLMNRIAHLQDRIQGSIDVDNYSIGRVFLPLSAMPHGRMSGSAKHDQAVEISPEFTSKDADVTGPEPPIEAPRTKKKDLPGAISPGVRAWAASRLWADYRTIEDEDEDAGPGGCATGSNLNRKRGGSRGAKPGANNSGSGAGRNRGTQSGPTGATSGGRAVRKSPNTRIGESRGAGSSVTDASGRINIGNNASGSNTGRSGRGNRRIDPFGDTERAKRQTKYKEIINDFIAGDACMKNCKPEMRQAIIRQVMKIADKENLGRRVINRQFLETMTREVFRKIQKGKR